MTGSGKRLSVRAAAALVLFAAVNLHAERVPLTPAERLGDGTLPMPPRHENVLAETRGAPPDPETIVARRDAIFRKTNELYDQALAAYSIGEYKLAIDLCDQIRSEERRVGKECRSRWAPLH